MDPAGAAALGLQLRSFRDSLMPSGRRPGHVALLLAQLAYLSGSRSPAILRAVPTAPDPAATLEAVAHYAPRYPAVLEAASAVGTTVLDAGAPYCDQPMRRSPPSYPCGENATYREGASCYKARMTRNKMGVPTKDVSGRQLWDPPVLVECPALSAAPAVLPQMSGLTDLVTRYGVASLPAGYRPPTRFVEPAQWWRFR